MTIEAYATPKPTHDITTLCPPHCAVGSRTILGRAIRTLRNSDPVFSVHVQAECIERMGEGIAYLRSWVDAYQYDGGIEMDDARRSLRLLTSELAKVASALAEACSRPSRFD